jgi:dual-specificity kinase
VTSKSFSNPLSLKQDIIPPTTDFNKQFLALLRKIFVYDPHKRITAKEALKHKWFQESMKDDGTEAAKIRRQRAAALAQVQEAEERAREEWS